MSIKILHLQGQPVHNAIIEDTLSRSGINHDLFKATDKATFLTALHNFQPDIILLCDDELSPSNPLDPIVILKDLKLTTPLIVINCSPSADFALRAISIMKLGAYDYLTKNNINKLPDILKEALNDTTLRKADETALKRSEANLSAIIENTTDLVYSLDKDLRFITFNQLFKNTIKQVYGFDVAQGVNTLDMLAGFDTDVAEKWKSIYAKALQGETIQFVNEYNFHNNRVWLSYSVNPIRETDKVIGLSCFSRDITQQKLDEEALKKSEASLRTIFNNTDMAIVLIDSEQKIVQFNTLAQKFAKEQYGLNIKKGDSVLDHVSNERHDHLRETFEKVKNGNFINYQTSRTVNGAVKWFDITWAGIKNNNNEDFGCIFTTTDITDKRKFEIEREKITADLIQRNKDLEQFTYIISHNLRAPVANIMGLSILLSELKNVEHEYSDTIEGIAVSANKLDEVILDLNQILQVSKSNEKIEMVSLTGLINDIQTSINNLIEKEDVKLGHDFSDADSIFTLKSYLHSIFYNLILNSIKYRKPGVSPVIIITSKTDNLKIKISYQDNGRGIDIVKNSKNLFGLYKRFDTSVEGKGMGLFMVKMQVESLGGTIALQSELGRGTRFDLEFPLSKLYEGVIEN